MPMMGKLIFATVAVAATAATTLDVTAGQTAPCTVGHHHYPRHLQETERLLHQVRMVWGAVGCGFVGEVETQAAFSKLAEAVVLHWVANCVGGMSIASGLKKSIEDARIAGLGDVGSARSVRGYSAAA
jgi:hypothetical protein